MKIETLYLKDFRRFDERTISFDKGLNIIYGKNEQGKSTILIALLTVLYFDANTKSSKILDKISPWGSDISPVIRLDYEFEGVQYSLEKDFQNHSQKIYDKKENKIIADTFSSIIKIVKEHTGIGSEQVFILTSLIAQNDIARVGNSKEKSPIKSLREAIDSSLLGGNKVDTGDLLKSLNKEIGNLDRGIDRVAKYPGEIKMLTDRLEDLQKQSREIRDSLSKLDNTKKDEDYQENLNRVEKEIFDLEVLVANDEKRSKYEKRLKELNGLVQEMEKRIREIDRLESKLNLIKKERDSLLVNADINSAKSRLLEIKVLIKDKLDEKDLLKIKLEDEKERIVKLQKKNKSIMKYGIFTSSVLSVILFFITHYNIFSLIIGVLIDLGIYFYFRNLSGENLISTQIGIEQDIKNIENSINLLEKEKLLVYEKLNVSSESELVSLDSRINLLDSEIAGYNAGLKTLTENTDLEQLKKQQIDYLMEKKDIEENKLTEEILSSKIDPMQKFSQSRRLEELKVQQMSLKEFVMKDKIEKENAKFTVDDLNSVEEEIYDVRKQMDYYKNKSKILKLVSEYIEKARSTVLKQSSSIIAEYAENFLPRLTNNKYSKIKITLDFQFMVFSNEKNDWLIPDDYLSQGAIDQIYFVIRFAILTVICKDLFPPIIIDDAFVTFDEERLGGVQTVLDEISNKYQIIILTCHKDYNSWGNVIGL